MAQLTKRTDSSQSLTTSGAHSEAGRAAAIATCHTSYTAPSTTLAAARFNLPGVSGLTQPIISMGSVKWVPAYKRLGRSKKLKSGFTCSSRSFKEASGTGANISQPLFSYSTAGNWTLGLRNGSPMHLTAQPWRRFMFRLHGRRLSCRTALLKMMIIMWDATLWTCLHTPVAVWLLARTTELKKTKQNSLISIWLFFCHGIRIDLERRFILSVVRERTG